MTMIGLVHGRFRIQLQCIQPLLRRREHRRRLDPHLLREEAVRLQRQATLQAQQVPPPRSLRLLS